MFSTADSKLQGVENVQLGSGASVTLTGQTEGFNVIGGGGAETIITSTGNDTVNAGLGNDFIQAAAGADVINGGAGQDTVSYADVTGVTSHGEAAITGMAVNFSGESVADADITTVMGAGIVTGNFDPNALLASGTVQYLTAAKGTTADEYSVDTVTSIEGFVGSALNDYIVLGADAVTVDAGAGDDAIFSGTAADNINAGSGDDTILIGSSADHGAAETIQGGSGDDTIIFTSELGETLVLSANVTGVETVQLTEIDGTTATTTNENIDASALTYGLTIVGNAGTNTLTGTAFVDTFDGTANGNYTFVVSDGDTVTSGTGAADTMIVNANATFTDARLAAVEIAQLASGVELTVDWNDVDPTGDLDTVIGVADGATEKLIVTGSTLGNDVGATGALIDFSAGLTLTNVDFEYRGGAGGDFVNGTAGADVISGGFGDDELGTGGGADTLTGGDGDDLFIVSSSNSLVTTITDFEVGTAVPNGDTLDVLDIVLTAVAREDILGGVVTRADGLTIESYEVSGTGVVTLYDTNTALGLTTEVFAESTAEAIDVANALLLNILSTGGGAIATTAITFGLDADGDGTAESTMIASTDGTDTNIVQLVGVAFGNDLATGGPAANTIDII